MKQSFVERNLKKAFNLMKKDLTVIGIYALPSLILSLGGLQLTLQIISGKIPPISTLVIYGIFYGTLYFFTFIISLGAVITKTRGNVSEEPISVLNSLKAGVRKFPRLLGAMAGVLIATLGPIGACMGILLLLIKTTGMTSISSMANLIPYLGAGIFAIIPTIILSVYLGIRLLLATPASVLEKESFGLKESWSVTEENFWDISALLFILFLVSGALGMVPYIGPFINMFLFSPYSMIVYTLAYLELKE